MLRRLAAAIEKRFGGGWWSNWAQSYLEDPANKLDDPFFYGRQSAAGMPVSEYTALMIPAFWQGVNVLAGDVAKIPLEIYRRKNKTDREIDSTHPAYQIVRYAANEEQSSYDFWHQMMTNKTIWNNAYAWIDRDGTGRVRGLYPLLPDRTECERIDGRKVYRSEVNGNIKSFDSYDIFHIKGLSVDGDRGLKLVYFMRDAIGKCLAREQFASRFFRNGGRVGGILELSSTKSKTAVDKIEQGFRRTYEDPTESFKTVILRDNAKFHAAQSSFRDTQLVEVAQEDIRQTARMLNIPPHKLGDNSAKSYNSLEAENRSYFDSSLSPHLCNIAAECWLKLFDRNTRTSNSHFFEHTIAALLWADSKTVAEIGSRGVLAGWLKPNEPRRWFNLNAEPDGDKLLIPSGMVDPSAEPVDQSEPPEPSEPNEETERALRGLIQTTSDRFRKRLETQYSKHEKAGAEQRKQWLESGVNDNAEIGSQMFREINQLEESFGIVPKEYANGIIEDFVKGKHGT